MRFMSMVLALGGLSLVGGCDGDGSVDIGNGDDGWQNVATDQDGDGTPDPLGEPSETFTGNLSDGEVISVDWADDSGLFCWPATENGNFDGAHVLFPSIAKEGSGNIMIQVDPDDGVDISFYTLENLPANEANNIPPNVTSATRCESAMDQTNDSNPGDTEVLADPLIGYTDRVILLGVAGANGATSGGFTVGIWRLEGGLIDGDTGT